MLLETVAQGSDNMICNAPALSLEGEMEPQGIEKAQHNEN